MKNKWQVLFSIVLVFIVSLGFNVIQVHDVRQNDVPERSSMNHPGLIASNVTFLEGVRLGVPDPNLRLIENHTLLNFTFAWEPGSQRIINSTLQLNVTLCYLCWYEINLTDSTIIRKTCSLTVITKVNDCIHDFSIAGFVFDSNHDGHIDHKDAAYAAFSNNETDTAFLMDNGDLALAVSIPYRSPNHIAIFNPAEGYTFIYNPYAGSSSFGSEEGQETCFYVCYVAAGSSVYVRFSFRVPTA